MPPFHYITYIYCFSDPNFASSCLKPFIENAPCCINRLCLSLLSIKYIVYVIWTFCCTRNKAFMKASHWFYWTSNPQFWEKSQLVSGAPKQPCSALHNFSWRHGYRSPLPVTDKRDDLNNKRSSIVNLLLDLLLSNSNFICMKWCLECPVIWTVASW